MILFFLFVYLFSSTELSELLKMPLLLEHYAEHQEKSKSLSFADFLYMHYIDYKNHSDDKDSDLPFQSQTHSEMIQFYVPLTPSNYLVTNLQLSDFDEKGNFYNVNSLHSSSYLSSIWQPPQIA